MYCPVIRYELRELDLTCLSKRNDSEEAGKTCHMNREDWICHIERSNLIRIRLTRRSKRKERTRVV